MRVTLETRAATMPPEQFPSPLLEIVVGSTLHGTSVNDGLEDLDMMAIVLEKPRQFVGFSPTDTWVHRTKPDGVRSEAGDLDLAVYGLRKYLHLALKGNPTILLALFAPEAFIRRHDVRGRQLQALAPYIVAKQVYGPFRGYMTQQHERLIGLRGQRNVTRPELVEKYGYDTKYAGHIVRLGLQGEEILLTGRMTLPMPEEQRQLVLSVRTGGYSLAAVSQLIIDVEKRIEAAKEKSTLPENPDRKTVEKWMLRQYLMAWRAHELDDL
jgi:predicted nucleotidyltransferase